MFKEGQEVVLVTKKKNIRVGAVGIVSSTLGEDLLVKFPTHTGESQVEKVTASEIEEYRPSFDSVWSNMSDRAERGGPLRFSKKLLAD